MNGPGSAVDQLVLRLGLEPHPEGGFYRRSWTSAERLGDRAALWTLIEHGHAAAAATLVYVFDDEHVDVPPL